MRKINENVAYAKAILNKKGITTESPEYNDYLNIRKICGDSNGYVGILTKIRFIDGVTDMDEIESIFDIFKNSKIDINKLNKMSYNEILDIFYDELNNTKEETKDFELIFKDEEYSYYRVYTYEGILKIGSPAWCLKTKSHWDNYQSKYPDQWVVIDNKYRNRILTPNTTYLSTYKTDKSWIRYGISLRENDDDTISWTGFCDNNSELTGSPDHWTQFGVLFTIFNLNSGIKKSYFEYFRGCELITGTKWHKVVDKARYLSRFVHSKYYDRLEKILSEENDIYVDFINPYASSQGILILNNHHIHELYPIDLKENVSPTTIVSDTAKKIILDYISDKNYAYFDGIKLANGLTTMEEIQSRSNFLKKEGKWLIFNHNKYYYLIVNTDVKDKFDIPTSTINHYAGAIDNPFAWYLNKDTFNPECNGIVTIQDYHKEIIDVIKKEKLGIVEVVPNKKVKGFWDFLKRSLNQPEP